VFFRVLVNTQRAGPASGTDAIAARSDAEPMQPVYWATCSSCACLLRLPFVFNGLQDRTDLGVDRGDCCEFFSASRAGNGVSHLDLGRFSLKAVIWSGAEIVVAAIAGFRLLILARDPV